MNGRRESKLSFALSLLVPFGVLMVVCLCAYLLGCQTTPARPLDPVEVDKCSVADRLGNLITDQIQKAFVCENRGAIKKDVIKKLYQFGLCSETQQGVAMREFLCTQLAIQSTRFVVNSSLPERWYCSGGEPAHVIYNYVFIGCMGNVAK